MKLKQFVYGGVIASLTAFGASIAFAEQFVSIGTGGVTGVYYPTGGAICRLVNKDRKTHGIRCSAESTGGSVYNINTVRAGELEFGVAQSDWQYHAYRGTSKFSDAGKFTKLRAVFSVHPEPFTLIVRKGSGITSFEGLKGKKVNVGNPGSGQRATMEVVMDAFGMKMSDFALASELKGSEQAQAICDGKIEAMIYTIGHPAAAVTQAASSCDVELVSVKGAPIDKLVAAAEQGDTLVAQAVAYRKIQSRLLQLLPYIPLWYEDHVFAARSDISGYQLASDGNYDGLISTLRTH